MMMMIPTLMRVRRTWAVRGTCRVILECQEPDLGAIGWGIGVFCSSTQSSSSIKKMVAILLANLNKSTVSLLVVEQPHRGVADDVRVDVDEILPILKKASETK